MGDTEAELIALALTLAADRPRWIEARALLLSQHRRIFGDGEGLLIRNEAPGGRLLVAIGQPARETLAEALEGRRSAELLGAPEEAEALAEWLPGWRREGVRLYGLRHEERLAPIDGSVRELRASDGLAHLDAELREELAGALAERPVCCAFADGLAASFAYSYWRTEGQFDISIDTAPAFRRRGLARLAVSELIRRERARGLRPVWGAMESNLASQGLARQLGFVQVDSLVLFSQPRG